MWLSGGVLCIAKVELAWHYVLLFSIIKAGSLECSTRASVVIHSFVMVLGLEPKASWLAKQMLNLWPIKSLQARPLQSLGT